MTLSAHREGVSAVQWLSDAEVVTASWDHSIKLWDLQQGTASSTLVRRSPMRALSRSPVLALVAQIHTTLTSVHVSNVWFIVDTVVGGQ